MWVENTRCPRMTAIMLPVFCGWGRVPPWRYPTDGTVFCGRDHKDVRESGGGSDQGTVCGKFGTPVAITLAQGLLKGRKMDLVVRQAVELGVARIVPLITARSVPALEGQRADTRTERWQKIARSAAQQSRREIIPRVEAPVPLDDFCAGHGSGGGIVLVFWEGKKKKGLLFERNGGSSRGVSRITVVVGPEGGLSVEEIESLKRCDAIIAGLGPRVLRAETAAVVGLALVQALLGDLVGERS